MKSVNINELLKAVPAPPAGHPDRLDLPQPGRLFSGENTGGETSNSQTTDNAVSLSSSEYPVFMFESTTHIENTCVGLLRGSSIRFCTRSKLPGHDSCQTVSHRSNKFQPQLHTTYIIRNQTSALAEPSLQVSETHTDRITELINSKHTMEHWTEIFAALSKEGPYSGLDFEEDKAKRSLNLMRNKLPLMTPAKFPPRRVAGPIKNEKTDDSSGETFFEPEGAKLELPEDAEQVWSLPASLLQLLKSIIDSLNDSRAQAFGHSRDLRGHDKFNKMIDEDLEILDGAIRQLASHIGKSVQIAGRDNPTVWVAIDALAEASTEELHGLDNQIKGLGDLVAGLAKDYKNFVLEQRKNWEDMRPLLLQIRDVIQSHMQFPLHHLNQRIDNLEGQPGVPTPETQTNLDFLLKTARRNNRTSFTEHDRYSMMGSDTVDDDSSYRPETRDLLSRIEALEEVVVALNTKAAGECVSYGQFHFRTIPDLKKWMTEHVKGYRFGYFVDGMSIWQFYLGQHKETDEVLSSQYSTPRVGFKTGFESKVSASFDHDLPTLLGKGPDTSKYLPACSMYDK